MADSKRQVVLDAIKGGLSQREAAVKFGVPSGTVAYWCKGEKDGKVVKLATVPPPPADLPPRAMPPGREVRAAAIGAALGDAARDDLRVTGGNLIRYLRQQTQIAVDGPPADVDPLEWRPPDMQQVAAAARSLDALLSRAADVLAFDERTAAAADKDALSDAEAVRAEVLRRRRG